MPEVGGRFVARLWAWFVAGLWGSIGGLCNLLCCFKAMKEVKYSPHMLYLKEAEGRPVQIVSCLALLCFKPKRVLHPLKQG